MNIQPVLQRKCSVITFGEKDAYGSLVKKGSEDLPRQIKEFRLTSQDWVAAHHKPLLELEDKLREKHNNVSHKRVDVENIFDARRFWGFQNFPITQKEEEYLARLKKAENHLGAQIDQVRQLFDETLKPIREILTARFTTLSERVRAELPQVKDRRLNKQVRRELLLTEMIIQPKLVTALKLAFRIY